MKATSLLLVLLGCLISLNYSWGIPGADVPWITYEAENGTYTGSLRGPSYALNTVEAESSGRRCVRLSSTGQYVQFTAVSNATAIVVRYSVPDTGDGAGADYTLSLYKNGALVGRLPVTSKYSWRYGSYTFPNTPSQGSPRNFYDEARTNGVSIVAGDVIKLQKDSTDVASYYDIDLVDLENVPAAISQPGGFVSVTGYGADATGVNDSTSAFNNCINANGSVWIPAGTYKITGTINLPSNRTIRGAGMWYSTLMGDPSVYGTASRRITLNGNGSNIQLSDLAIVGKLNYRSDSEANDGLGGSYGTGSSIANCWVEHTKTGAWIVNSSGLVVSGCRFRNTIADGINVCVGMRNTTVTNCTARGTGDDCFAIWPANYTTPAYAPGLNVITHCTGQTSCLAQGGAIYGGDSNRIEDCLFQDIPYECGILFSTQFPVSAGFSGTAVAQRCNVIRCGGTRAGLEITHVNSGIPGLNLNNLNIIDSATTGLKILNGAGGGLANAIMYNSTISTYNQSGSGGHGLWALSSAVGSLTVSNCVVSEYRDDSANFSFNFVTTTTIPVTVQTSPSGLTFTVDGTAYTSPQTFNWTTNSTHTIATTTPQTGGSAQYSWSSWSDGGAISHTVSPAVATTYTANFTATQYYLTMNAGTGGSVSPVSGWYNAGTNLNISATPSGGFTFSGWTGSGTGSYSGANNPASISMNGPITETANFNGGIFVTVQTSPAGRTFSVDGTSYSSPQVFNWAPYASHTIATTTPQSGGAGTQYVWSSWSDGGALLHYVAPATDTTYTANFTTQYYLTMNAGSGGSVSPASGWQNSGASVGITATASNGFAFSSWTGTGSGSYSGGANPSSVTMNAAISQTATFLVSSEQVQSLSFVQQPGNVNQGATITPSVQVQAIGTNSLPLAGVPINLSLGSGTGTLGGTLARTTDAGGVATFNDLNVNLAGPKILTATLGGKSTNSILFNVIGPAVGLAFTTQPGSAIAGQPFGQPPVVRTVDAFGTPSTVGLPASLMVSVALTNGAGTLSGTTTLDIGASAGNGVATFSNLSIDAAGAGNQLLASTGSTPITNPVSGAKIWLDASATASVLTNTSGIVTNWLDLSGNNNHFNQTIGSGAGIVYTNTVANGRKTVTFQAATELKNATYSNTNKTISVFLVAKKTVAGIADGQYQAVFGTWAAGATADYTDPGSFSLNYNISNTTPRVLRACCTTYVDNNCPAMDPAAGYHVFQYVANGVGSNDIWLTSISGTTQGNGPRLDSVSANFNIVASTVGGGLLTNDTTTKRPFAGSIAEVLVYNTALSTTERTSVTSYLTNKWLAAAAGYGLTSATSAPFDVQPLTITVTVQTSPAGHSFAVDGVVYSSAQTFNWIPGANHTVATTSPQNIGSGEWVWASWSDSGAISHTVAPVSSTSYTANFSFVVSLLGITTVSNGLVGLSYATASGLTYHVETTTNLTPAVWTPIPGSTTNADGNIIIFVDPNASADPQRFYRIRSP